MSCSVRGCADCQKEIADFARKGGFEHFICLRDLLAVFLKTCLCLDLRSTGACSLWSDFINSF